MKKQKVYILCGASGSGKSHWARNKAEKDSNVLIVNKDSLRTMLFGSYGYNSEVEKMVQKIANHSLELALMNGYSVIIDETNLTLDKRVSWAALAECFHTESVLVEFTTDSPDRNIERRMTDSRGVSKDRWREVIEGQCEQYEKPSQDELLLLYTKYKNIKNGKECNDGEYEKKTTIGLSI
jgi:predicted kinase